jgi:hypothetical protein
MDVLELVEALIVRRVVQALAYEEQVAAWRWGQKRPVAHGQAPTGPYGHAPERLAPYIVLVRQV